MAGRKSISKSVRFRVFARDEFTCRYCGQQPPSVQLVIDHIHPVAEGGTNEETNLIASCFECNAGKGKELLETLAPNDQDTARMAQEYLEQKQLADLTASAREAREQLKRHLGEYFADVLDFDCPLDAPTISRLVGLAKAHGPELVLEWIDIAAGRDTWYRQSHAMKYINGIARNVTLQNGGQCDAW